MAKRDDMYALAASRDVVNGLNMALRGAVELGFSETMQDQMLDLLERAKRVVERVVTKDVADDAMGRD